MAFCSRQAVVYGQCSYISVDECSPAVPRQRFAETGDVIEVEVMGNMDWKSEVLENFVPPATRNENSVLRGSVRYIWTVYSSTRKGDQSFNREVPHHLHSREKQIIAHLLFSNYRSPSDSIEVPEPDPPQENSDSDNEHFEEAADGSSAGGRTASRRMSEAMRTHRALRRQRQRRVEEAWAGWQKPLLKPGDVVALIAPISCPDRSLPSSPARLCLVQRFWTEQEERNRHVFWIPADAAMGDSSCVVTPEEVCSTMDMNSAALYRHVRRISLFSSPSVTRGYEKFEPVSSQGTLSSGERYFIYRFLLFWDGFEMTSGKQASGDGFYLTCLNIPQKARSSPNSVRIISLTPPGIKRDVVFKNIQDDIIRGMTEGFSDYDADGMQIRIFLDLVGFIGDTPAINAALDVLGHTGGACCHLCTFKRSPLSLVGGRFTRPVPGGLSSASGRRFYQHMALRDSNAQVETCRLLGMTPPDISKPLPIHNLRKSMFQAIPHIPTTDKGQPILSGYIDPYRSCLIGPDHLLTGHLRDCINAAFKLLPTKEHRKCC